MHRASVTRQARNLHYNISGDLESAMTCAFLTLLKNLNTINPTPSKIEDINNNNTAINNMGIACSRHAGLQKVS